MIIRFKQKLNMLAVLLMLSAAAFAGNNSEKNNLTTDSNLQRLAERLLNCKQGSITAIDPSTGEIKCLASNSFYADTINRAISVAYSPGSTFKTAQALTLLTENIINEQSQYSCNKGFWRGKIHIGCHPHANNLSLINAIAHSCNSYFCKAFMAMISNRGKYQTRSQAIDLWYSYMQSMGFAAPLGVDIPGEVGGEMANTALLWNMFKGKWNEQTIMWVGMGQGEALTTPLQLCNLAASIANRGYYITPHINHYSETDSLYTKYTEKHLTKATPESYDIVIKGMRKAVTNGTCAMINTPSFQICGKTGTAENPGDDHSIFIGFAPMDNPKIAVCVYIENGGFGADMAAPMAQLLMEQYITGELSKRSEHKVKQWEDYIVVPNSEKEPTTDPALKGDI